MKNSVNSAHLALSHNFRAISVILQSKSRWRNNQTTNIDCCVRKFRQNFISPKKFENRKKSNSKFYSEVFRKYSYKKEEKLNLLRNGNR